MKNIGLFCLALVSLTSCQDIIEYDLNSADPKYVIEGFVTDDNRPFSVKISKTTDYFNPTTPPSVSNAFVEIADNAGNRDTLKETAAGVYTTQKLQTALGRTYTLTVKTADQTFTAVSTMPSQKVTIDSITQLKSDAPFGGTTTDSANINLFVRFKDPKGLGNYYRTKLNVNGQDRTGIDVQSDGFRIADGSNVQMPAFNQGLVSKNDVVKIELWSMNAAAFDYFNSLSSLTSQVGGGSAAPANPNTNIKGGALGYFFAVTTASKQYVVK